MHRFDQNFWLEILNGTQFILSSFTGCFLLYHFAQIGLARRLTIPRWLMDMPQSMRLVIAIFVLVLGLGLTRMAVWYWRFTTEGNALLLSRQFPLLIFGNVATSLGFIMIIRVVTRPMDSDWPWITAALATLFYLALMVGSRIV